MNKGMRTWLVAAAIVAAGCDKSSADTTKPDTAKDGAEIVGKLTFDNPFPSEAAIEALANNPPTSTPKPWKIAEAAHWKFKGPAPKTVGVVPLEGGSKDEKLILDVASEAAPTLKPTQGMFCLARELGHFVLEHNADAPPDIRGFMAARCGVTDTSQRPRWNYAPGRRRKNIKRQALREHLATGLKLIPEGARYGMWSGDNKDGLVTLVVHSVQSDLAIEPFAMDVSDTSLQFRGRLSADYAAVNAFVTKGSSDAARCTPVAAEMTDGRTIAFRCPLDRAAASAVVEVSRLQPGGAMSRVVARLFVSPDGSMPAEYDVRELVASLGNEKGASGRTEAINAVRKQLGRSPVVVSEEESAVVESLLPHYLATITNTGQETDVAAAMIAGWGVDGLVAGAGWLGRFGHPEWSNARHVAASMQMPYFRYFALSEATSVIATATSTFGEGPEVGVTVDVGYELFRPVPFERQEQAILNSLDLRRADAGQPPVLRVEGENDRAVLDAAAGRLRSGEGQPEQELSDLLHHFANETGRMFRGIVMVPMLIEGWYPRFDEPLLNEPNIAVAVKVSYFNPDKGPWGRWIVLLVYTVLEGPMK